MKKRKGVFAWGRYKGTKAWGGIMIVGKDNTLLFADARSLKWTVVRQAGSKDRTKPLRVLYTIPRNWNPNSRRSFTQWSTRVEFMFFKIHLGHCVEGGWNWGKRCKRNPEMRETKGTWRIRRWLTERCKAERRTENFYSGKTVLFKAWDKCKNSLFTWKRLFWISHRFMLKNYPTI